MNVEFLDDFEAVDPGAWNALLAAASTDTIFQTWAWQRAWWRAYARPGRLLRLVAVFEGDVLRVVMPLFLEKRVLRFIGHGVSDTFDLIYDAGRSVDLLALFTALMEREDWDEIDLAGLPEASATWRYLKILAEEAGAYPVSMGKYPLWGVRLEGREERLNRFLHSGPLSRQAGILFSQGNVSVAHHQAPAPGTISWKEFFIQHIHRWVLRAEPGCFVERARRDLCRYVTGDPALNEALVVTRIDLNGRPAAFQMNFVYRDVFYAGTSSFDIALKRFSPDDVIWREIVGYALERGCRAVVFTAPEEASVKRYADRIGVVRHVRIFRSRRRQWLARLLRAMGKVPLAGGIRNFAREMGKTAVVFFTRQRIVRTRRQAAEGCVSFDDLYAGKELPSCARPLIMRPEIELLRRLRPEWKDISMLDMGLGQGRTGTYFAPTAGLYHGFDRSPEMVAAARERLDDMIDPAQIFQADAMSMGFAADGAYDLVLFGGEGIDEVSVQDRARILAEVHRVGREGAWFFFSSRNLQCFRGDSGYRGTELLRHWQRRWLMAAANPGLKLAYQQPSTVLFDERGAYRLPVHYVTPGEQVRLLKEAGFHDVRVFSTRTGLEVRDWRRWVKLTDPVLYYLCRA